MLGTSVESLLDLTHEEIMGWAEYFERRPYGWREDNRAAVIAMSLGGGDKLKPEDLFGSLKVIKQQNTETNSAAQKFYKKFSGSFTEGAILD